MFLLLPARQFCQLSYRLQPTRRGHFHFEHCEIRLFSPLGLWRERRLLPLPSQTRVRVRILTRRAAALAIFGFGRAALFAKRNSTNTNSHTCMAHLLYTPSHICMPSSNTNHGTHGMPVGHRHCSPILPIRTKRSDRPPHRRSLGVCCTLWVQK